MYSCFGRYKKTLRHCRGSVSYTHLEVYKKQSGGRGKFADIIVRIEPADEGFEGSLQFIDEVKGDVYKRQYVYGTGSLE